MLTRTTTFLKREAVLCIAFICACASVTITGDVVAIADYVDWRVISLLFCLTSATAGLSESGAIDRASRALVAGDRSKRLVCFALVMLPFFVSMLVTNDVALLSVVPIAIIALEAAGWRKSIPLVIVLQTIAANLGGMLTPIGNPQNLFIFTTFGLTTGDFFVALAPFGLLAFVILAACCIAMGKGRARVRIDASAKPFDAHRFGLHATLFVLSVLAVVRIIPYQVVVGIIIVTLAMFDRPVFAKIDYGLLATFICFFVFSGSLAHIPTVQASLGSLMQSHPMLTALLASQVISNVPASVLLAEFTGNWHSLLVGVDLGGLGTPVASLASLIAFRIYLQSRGASSSAFMSRFVVANVAVLAAMVALYAVLFVA